VNLSTAKHLFVGYLKFLTWTKDFVVNAQVLEVFLECYKKP